MSGKTRTVKKSPFMLLVRFGGWPTGQYMILPGEPFENTKAAASAREDALKANGIDPAAVIREHGKITVAVAQFTEVVHLEPHVGYRVEEQDAMEVIPVTDGPGIREPVDPTPAKGEAAPAPEKTAPEPKPSTKPQAARGVDPTPKGPEAPEPAPKPVKTKQEPPAPPPAPRKPEEVTPPAPPPAPADAGDTATAGDPWDNFGDGDPVPVDTPEAAPETPGSGPPAEPPGSADDVLV